MASVDGETFGLNLTCALLFVPHLLLAEWLVRRRALSNISNS